MAWYSSLGKVKLSRTNLGFLGLTVSAAFVLALGSGFATGLALLVLLVWLTGFVVALTGALAGDLVADLVADLVVALVVDLAVDFVAAFLVGRRTRFLAVGAAVLVGAAGVVTSGAAGFVFSVDMVQTIWS